MLTGPPRILGVPTPYASLEGYVDVRWARVTRLLEGRVVDRVASELYELRAQWSWRALSYGDLRQLQGILTTLSQDGQPGVEVVPRSRADGDPAVAELAVRCRFTSDIQETAPLAYRDAWTGAQLYDLEVEAVSLARVAAIPGALYGGLILVDHDTSGALGAAATVEPWGVAVLTEAPLALTFEGVVYEGDQVTLSPDDIEAAVLLPHPTDPDVVLLDTINDYQAPPVAS